MQSTADLCSTRLASGLLCPAVVLYAHSVREAMLLSAVRGAREWQHKIKVLRMRRCRSAQEFSWSWGIVYTLSAEAQIPNRKLSTRVRLLCRWTGPA